MKYVIAILLAIGCSVVATAILKMFGDGSSWLIGAVGGGVGAFVTVSYISYSNKKEKHIDESPN
jgi:multidrug transporter EmrE-like cation transporter